MIQTYKDVLHGNLTPDEAKSRWQSETHGEDVKELFVTPETVGSMLNKYLAGQVDAQSLSDWAAFLTSCDVYVTHGWKDDSQADKYEPMWEILQQLSTPSIDGPITKNRVKSYINLLSNITAP
ncbi:MAG: hypothetical protein WD397_11490 [Wenzhouxiangellaceae bacterium]